MSLRTWFNSSTATTLDFTSQDTPSRARRPRRTGAAGRTLRSWLGGDSGGAACSRNTPAVAEWLENRQLLTLLVGGDQFYFRDDRDNVIRIRAEGNVQVEVVGAEINEDNTPVLRDLAGRLYRPDPTGVLVPVELNGGLLPQNGAQAIGPILIPGVANPTINAVAASNNGTIYAFNVIELQNQGGGGGTTDTAQVQLIQLNVPAAGSGNVTATIIDPDLGGAQGFTNVTGADFNPVTGQLFIAATVETQNGGNQQGSLLYTLNVNSPNPGATLGLIGAFTAGGGAQGPQGIQVTSIAFNPAGQLFGVSDAGFFAGGPGGVVPQPVTIVGNGGGGGSGGGTVTGIDFNPFTGDFLGVTTGSVTAPVVNLCSNGRAINYGPLGVGNITSLSFVPGLPDPFTQNPQGSYVAVDSGTDNLYFIDPTNRLPPQTIYNIYVLQSDESGGISIGFVHTISEIFTPPNSIFDPIQPYEGEAGPFSVFNINDPPPPIYLANAQGTGRALIGARTQPGCDPNIPDNIPIDDVVPLPAPVPGAPPPLQFLPPSVTALGPGISMNPGQRLGTFLLGGTLMGSVNVGGSIDQMYIGWILTGNANGQTSVLSIDRPENFHVAGDLRELYTIAPIGTDAPSALLRDTPNYVTGFDMQVDGTLGHVNTLDSIYGSIEVDNRPEDDPNIGFPDWPQREMEFKTVNNATAFDQFLLTGQPGFFNDTFDTAEYRGSISTLGQTDMVRATGQLQATPILQDYADYYAVGLMAGQTVGVQLFVGGAFAGTTGTINVGVFDPDGRLVGSDNNQRRTHDTSGEYFEVTADRPGIYRFAIAQAGNPLFQQATPGGLLAVFPYELRITKTGDIGIGGITATNQIFDLFDPGGTVDHAPGEDPGFELRNGDIGAIRAGNEFFSPNFSVFGGTIRVEQGNLRAVDGASIGFSTGTAPNIALNDFIVVVVPNGSVGLLRSRTGILYVNDELGMPSIGGDFQLIDAATTFLGQMTAKGGIGVVRAGDMATLAPSSFFVNTDNTGRDGIIDLIDCAGDLGTIGAGGPAISTGEGGNVRYMRVGGQAFIDSFFGSGGGIETQHAPGEIVTLKDDSGANINFTPSLQVLNPAFDPVTNPTVPQLLAPDATLTIRSYPIRGSGGVAVIDVTSTNSVVINGGGDSEDASVEIGAVVIQGEGQPVLHSNFKRVVPLHPRRARNNGVNDLVDFTNPFDPINPGSGGGLGEPDYQAAPNPLFLYPQPRDLNGDGVLDEDLNFDGIADGPVTRPQPFQQDLNLEVGGNARVDIFDVFGGYDRNNAALGDALAGRFTEINNSTGGEIVNMHIRSVGNLISKGNIGVAESHISGTAVNPLRVISGPNTATPTDVAGATAGVSPFWGNHTGIVVQGPGGDEPGNVISIKSDGAIGNVIVGGSIGSVIADADGHHDQNDGVFEGITGVVWADGFADGTAVGTGGGPVAGGGQSSLDPGGDLYNVDVGEGILPGGSGAFSRAGIFANRRIDTVTGTNASIRGDIFAGDGVDEPYETAAPVAPTPGTGGGGGGNATAVAPTPIGTGPGGRELITDSIGRVVLKNSSIINADIVVATAPDVVWGIPRAGIQPEITDDVNDPFYEIGQILVTHGGGIIGSNIAAADVGAITVRDGFGVFTTMTSQIGDGRVKGIDADGYGIRGVTRDGGASQNYLIARGDGSSVSTTKFDPQVRLSEQYSVDPYFGTAPTVLTDIHSVLGTSASQPEIPGRTDTGVIEDTSLFMQRDLDKVSAYQIRANNPLVGTSTFNVGNSINQVHVRDDINGLSITTGTVKVFRPNADVFNLNMTVAGPIKNMVIQGDLANNSQILTNGKNGNIQFMKINGRMDGTIRANGKIGRLFVGQAITGRISSTRRGGGNALDQLIIGGPLGAGNLEIEGNVGKIIAAQDLGRTGENLFIRGSIKLLQVNGNLFANVIVANKLNSLKVGGSIMAGSTVQAQQIGSITVGGDVQAGSILRAKKFGKQHIGGQLLGDIEPLT